MKFMRHIGVSVATQLWAAEKPPIERLTTRGLALHTLMPVNHNPHP